MSFDLPAILSKANLELIAAEKFLEFTQTDISPTSAEDAASILDDKEAEEALLRKLDIHVILPLSVIFFWCYVDRINFGYAKLQGIEKDLHMIENYFNISLLVQMVFLCSFEIPSNLMITQVRPSLWLGAMSLGWGLMTLGQGLVHSYSGRLVLRSFLWAFDSGLIPGAIYLISMYYTRAEIQKRMAVLYVANLFAIATSGLIAYGINNLKDVAGLLSWRWIFIIEGTITIGLTSIVTPFLTDWPEQAKWLSLSELRLLEERRAAANDWKIYSAFVIFFCIAVSLNSTAFIPSIVADLGHSNAAAQALTGPIYIVAGVLGFVAAILADRMGNRFTFAFFGAMLGIAELILLLNGHILPPRIQYAALYLFIGGFFMTVPSQVAWASNNIGGHYKQGFCAAVQIGLGSTGAFVPLMTFVPSDAPSYTRAFRICLSLTVLAAVVMILTEVGLWWENKQRKAGKRDWGCNFQKMK